MPVQNFRQPGGCRSRSEETRRSREQKIPLYWHFNNGSTREPPPLKHAVLSALGAQHENETPPCMPLRRQGGEGTRVLYARGAGSGGKTCTLTSWYAPSPLGPGADPRPWNGAGRQGSCNNEWTEGGTEMQPCHPLARAKGLKGPCCGRRGSKR